MKHLCIFLLAAFLCPVIGFAQSNFKPGYLVTLKGDTLKGEVDYREWNNNPGTITFKGADGLTKKVGPTDVYFININGLDAYQSYTGRLSNDETVANRVGGGRDTSSTVQTVFLKLLQQGKIVSLYSYTDATKPRYFISEPGEKTPRELVYRVYNDDKKGNNSTVNENTFVQQLTTIALKTNVLDDKLQSYLDNPAYTAPSLLKIVTKMNGLTKADLSQNEPQGAKSFDIYAGLALHANSTQPKDNFKTVSNASAYTSYLPKALVGFSFYANPNTRALVFSIELAAALGKYQTDYNKFQNNNGAHFSYNQLVISLAPQVAYNIYNADNLKFSLAAGFDAGYCSYSNVTATNVDGSPTNFNLFPYSFRSFMGSPFAKAGVLLNKRVQLYGSYTQGGTVTQAGYYSLSQHLPAWPKLHPG